MEVTDQNHQKQLTAILTTALVLAVAVIACSGLGRQVDVEATIAAGVAATRQAEVANQATIEAAIAATQGASVNNRGAEILPQTAPTATPTVVSLLPVPTASDSPSPPDRRDVRDVIANEVKNTTAKDLTRLESLYAPNAIVIDRHGTPNDPNDDTIWNGWPKIEERYRSFFSIGFSSLTLVDLSIELSGNRATGTYQGIILDETFYEDRGIYTLEQSNGEWLIIQLEFGHMAGYAGQLPADDGLYILKIGSQHRYEEPWGWDRGDPCEAWRTGNFDDTKPNYRGFNVELLLTNNSEEKIPDDWPISFTTAKGKLVSACQYAYEGSGPPPGATSSLTFFTVVEKGDYVETITLNLKGQLIRLCLDGEGGSSPC